MKRLLWFTCCSIQSLVWMTAAQATPISESPYLPTTFNFSADRTTAIQVENVPTNLLAQAISPAESPSTPPSPPEPIVNDDYKLPTSPGFSIFNPVGFGADNNTVFFSVSYQKRTRFTQIADGEAGFGVGLGDAYRSLGAELSYSINSFGSSAGFGSGAFNIKLHKRLSEDTSVAVGWNQFLQVRFRGGPNLGTDFPSNSYYVAGTKIFRTRANADDLFSRVAVTGGIGSGVFLRFDRTLSPGASNSGLNAFGSVGVRVARPVSAILEWTGQDLAAGLSVAPFENFPLVITPAIRDLAGAGDGARFVVGSSVFFNF
jgi:hypothetical protein